MKTRNILRVLRIILVILPEHQSDTKVFTVMMEILPEPASNKLCVGFSMVLSLYSAVFYGALGLALFRWIQFENALLCIKKPDRPLTSFEADNGNIILEEEFCGHSSYVNDAILIIDGLRLITASSDCTVKVELNVDDKDDLLRKHKRRRMSMNGEGRYEGG
ncbi:hypothetical protein Tco_0762091 [Tanacetum coccineum]